MRTYTVRAVYGLGNPCDLFCCEDADGGTWYAVVGSINVNYTYDPIEDGVNVESLRDVDTFTWDPGIDSEDDLEEAIAA